MNRFGLPNLGDGVGLRPVHYSHLYNTPPEHWGVDWFEIVSEDYFDNRGRPMLAFIRERRPIVMHGVSLNIGSTDPLNMGYLRKLAALADRVNPAWISDHLCWTGVGGINSHDLWPVPLTAECHAHIVQRVRAVQDYLGRPLILENPSSYLDWQCSEISEWEFLAELVERADCGLLLDVNNVHVSSVNHGFDPFTYINGLPADAIVYVHIAGSTDHGAYRIDTHSRAVDDAVWPLYALAQARTGGVPTLLEWDSDIPPFPQLAAELAKARQCRTERYRRDIAYANRGAIIPWDESPNPPAVDAHGVHR